MRKTMGFIIALAAAGLLAGCSGNGAAGQTSAAQTSAVQASAAQTSAEQAFTEQVAIEAQTSAMQEETALPETENSDGQEEGGKAGEGTEKVQGGKTLVVYYSASGNTEQVAGYIAKAAGGDLFELEPVEPYTSADLNWSDDNSRVTVEHENPDQREVELVKDTVEDWDTYDTVFIGYPIWWGIAAWPVDGFVKANDFTRKTVIPFCTSSSSGLGESGELLAELAGTGDWLEGMRFRSSASEADVTAWVEGLGQ